MAALLYCGLAFGELDPGRILFRWKRVGDDPVKHAGSSFVSDNAPALRARAATARRTPPRRSSNCRTSRTAPQWSPGSWAVRSTTSSPHDGVKAPRHDAPASASVGACPGCAYTGRLRARPPAAGGTRGRAPFRDCAAQRAPPGPGVRSDGALAAHAPNGGGGGQCPAAPRQVPGGGRFETRSMMSMATSASLGFSC